MTAIVPRRHRAPHGSEEGRLLLASLLFGAPLRLIDGQRVGRIVDVVARLGGSGRKLHIVGLRAEVDGRDCLIELSALQALSPAVARGERHDLRVRGFHRSKGDLLLRADLLDRAMIDVANANLVRAYDIVLAAHDRRWEVAAIDPRRRARARRLLPRSWRANATSDRFYLQWESIEPFIKSAMPSRLGLVHRRLARLHPAQLADLIEAASPSEGEEIFEAAGSTPGLKALVLEELDDKHRGVLLRERSNRQVADLLAQLPSDDVADLVLELDQPRRRELLELLPAPARKKVEALLAYNARTAGGLMSADFLSVPFDATQADIVTAVCVSELDSSDLLAIYVQDGRQQLLGTISLAALIRSAPGQTAAFLATDTVTTVVHADVPVKSFVVV